MNKVNLSRRYFSLDCGKFLLVFANIGLFHWIFSTDAKNKYDRQSALMRFHITNMISAQFIAKKYISQNAIYITENVARQRVFVNFFGNTEKEFSKYVSNRIKQDFREEKIVDVDGYQLSRMEVDLCVLCQYVS